MNRQVTKKHTSLVINRLLCETTQVEQMQTKTKMALAARLNDFIVAKGWSKKEFAEKVNKNPSEITKWLSGTHNFTIETLAEIGVVLDISLEELFAYRGVPSIKYLTPLSDSTTISRVDSLPQTFRVQS